MKKWLIVTLALAGVSGLLILSVPLMHVLQEDSRKRFAAENPMTSDTLYIAVNRVRADNRLPQFKRNHLLDDSAKMKCDDMVKNDYYFSHKVKGTNDVLTPEMSVHAYRDCTFVSENIFWGKTKTQTPLDWWNNSPPHRTAMIDPRYEYIGIGISDWRVVTHFCDID